MARDHARIRLDIWADDDFRDLPSLAQWLYLQLLTSPSLNFCGVADWRPARIAGVTSDLAGGDIEYAARFLEAGAFLVIDRSTEEALIRSFVKHDGLLRSPNVTKALVKAHAEIGSAILRAVIVGQLKSLHKKEPDLCGWAHLGSLLQKRSMTVGEAFRKLSPNPSVKGSVTPSEDRASLLAPNSLLHSPVSIKSKTLRGTSPGASDLGIEKETR